MSLKDLGEIIRTIFTNTEPETIQNVTTWSKNVLNYYKEALVALFFSMR